MKSQLYERFHRKSKSQQRIISDNNFTYINLLPPLNALLSKKISNILDIGCGSGAISLYLASKGYKVTGIDISNKAINVCIKSANNMGIKNAKFEVLDFPKDIPRQRYDFIFCSEVIEHLADDNLALKTIFNLLNPNGILFLSTPSSNAPLHKIGYSKKFDKEVGHLRRYSINDLNQLLKVNGFRVLNTYKKESILRNFLYLNPIAGKSIRFIKFFMVSLITTFDNFLVTILGESQIIIVAKKNPGGGLSKSLGTKQRSY